MTQLFSRRIALQVDTIKISTELRVTFKATKTWRPEPNTCEIEIYNLSPEHRKQLTSVKSPIVKLAAGYTDDSNALTQLFYGEAIFVKHEIKGPDHVTTVSTTDGGEKKRTARINVTFGANTKTSTVLKRIIQELGIDPGNSAKVAAEIDRTMRGNLYVAGVTISGSAADELSHLCRSCGYDWSIQDGGVQLAKVGQAASKFAVRLDPESGLIGSPSISNKGVVSGQCLLFKAGSGLDLVPGRLVNIASEYLQGQFVLAKLDFAGDTYADDWSATFEAVASKGKFSLVK